MRIDPEPPVSPPDIPDREYICLICGGPARQIYFDDRHDIFGCDLCVKSDFIDDILGIPENEPLPKCDFCGTREQTVYIDKSGEIRGCFHCVNKKPAEEADL